MHDINASTNNSIIFGNQNQLKYEKGPIKTLKRCKKKACNDYIIESFQISANI